MSCQFFIPICTWLTISPSLSLFLKRTELWVVLKATEMLYLSCHCTSCVPALVINHPKIYFQFNDNVWFFIDMHTTDLTFLNGNACAISTRHQHDIFIILKRKIYYMYDIYHLSTASAIVSPVLIESMYISLCRASCNWCFLLWEEETRGQNCGLMCSYNWWQAFEHCVDQGWRSYSPWSGHSSSGKQPCDDGEDVCGWLSGRGFYGSVRTLNPQNTNKKDQLKQKIDGFFWCLCTGHFFYLLGTLFLLWEYSQHIKIPGAEQSLILCTFFFFFWT